MSTFSSSCAYLWRTFLQSSLSPFLGFTLTSCNTMSSVFAPFCNKLSIAIHYIFVSAYHREVHFRTSFGLLASTPGKDTSFYLNGLLWDAAKCKAVLPHLSETFIFVFFFRNTLTVSMSLFKIALWIAESFASIRSKIFCVNSYINLKRWFEMKFSLFEKLPVNHFAVEYSAKHWCIKCNFPSIISLIIPNCSALPLCRNLIARWKSLTFIAPRSLFPPPHLENKDIKDVIVWFPKYDSFSIFHFWFWAVHNILFTEVNIAFLFPKVTEQVK